MTGSQELEPLFKADSNNVLKLINALDFNDRGEYRHGLKCGRATAISCGSRGPAPFGHRGPRPGGDEQHGTGRALHVGTATCR